MRACACVRACVRAGVRACVRACVCMQVSARARVCGVGSTLSKMLACPARMHIVYLSIRAPYPRACPM